MFEYKKNTDMQKKRMKICKKKNEDNKQKKQKK